MGFKDTEPCLCITVYENDYWSAHNIHDTVDPIIISDEEEEDLILDGIEV